MHRAFSSQTWASRASVELIANRTVTPCSRGDGLDSTDLGDLGRPEAGQADGPAVDRPTPGVGPEERRQRALLLVGVRPRHKLGRPVSGGHLVAHGSSM